MVPSRRQWQIPLLGSTNYILCDTKYINYDRAMGPKAESPLALELVDAVVQLSFAVHEVLSRVAATYDLSVTQLRLLGILRDRTPPMSAIATHMGLDRSSVTGLIDRAERRGLVVRVASTTDARVTTVRVTPKGDEVGAELISTIATEIEAMMVGLTKTDRQVLRRVAQSILESQEVEGLPLNPALSANG
jgi:MarR family transcriptional regulator, lower aerobic nicotinate degradation pathway regulator